jgi:hypothetical protein
MEQQQRSPRIRAWATLVGLGVISAAAASLGIIAGGLTAGEAVASAVTTTQAQRTADITISGAEHVSTHAVPIRGNGQVDFTTHTEQLQLAETVSGRNVEADEVASGGTVYVRIPKGISTKSWLSINAPAGSLGTAVDSLTTNATTILKIFTNEGATYSSLGTSTRDGLAVQGYRFELDNAAIQALFVKSGASQALRQVAAHELSSLTLSGDLYVNSAQQVQSADLALKFALANGSGTLHGAIEVTLTLSNYGSPVTITIPPAATVITAAQLAQARR